MAHPTFEEFLKEQNNLSGTTAGDSTADTLDKKLEGVDVKNTQPETAPASAEADGAANPKDGTGKPLTGAQKAAAEKGTGSTVQLADK